MAPKTTDANAHGRGCPQADSAWDTLCFRPQNFQRSVHEPDLNSKTDSGSPHFTPSYESELRAGAAVGGVCSIKMRLQQRPVGD